MLFPRVSRGRFKNCSARSKNRRPGRSHFVIIIIEGLEHTCRRPAGLWGLPFGRAIVVGGESASRETRRATMDDIPAVMVLPADARAQERVDGDQFRHERGAAGGVTVAPFEAGGAPAPHSNATCKRRDSERRSFHWAEETRRLFVTDALFLGLHVSSTTAMSLATALAASHHDNAKGEWWEVFGSRWFLNLKFCALSSQGRAVEQYCNVFYIQSLFASSQRVAGWAFVLRLNRSPQNPSTKKVSERRELSHSTSTSAVHAPCHVLPRAQPWRTRTHPGSGLNASQ